MKPYSQGTPLSRIFFLFSVSIGLISGCQNDTVASSKNVSACINQPEIKTHNTPLLRLEGCQFRDMNRNGALDEYEDWRKAGKSVEFHVYASGSHGFGLGYPGTTATGWAEDFYEWLQLKGFLSVNQM